MFLPRCLLLALVAGVVTGLAGDPVATPPAAPAAVRAGKKVIFEVPVRDEINRPTLYILRRALKEAAEQKADAIVLDMNTPGGELGTTFEIMEALEKFPGEKITYVNKEAMSAGSFIAAVTDEIYFAPTGVIGAAAPVLSTGGDVDKTMKQKIVSYLRARIRASSEGKGFRGEVISAMIDEDLELKIGDKVLKPKGELLSLTATEALEKYGDPPRALLGAGKAADVDALLTAKFGAGNYEVRHFKVTWSEEVAQYLTAWSPVLMGLGILALFIEFKTPGFGVFGAIGVVLLAVVFLGSYVAGFSGHEPVLVFLLGLMLVAVELIFFPGVAVVAVAGFMLMLGSLVWAMADLWPGEPIGVAWDGDVFVEPLRNLGIGLALSAVLAAVLLRYLPKGWVWDRMVVGSAIGGAAQNSGGAPGLAQEVSGLVGRHGVAVTALRPGGQVEVAGRRYEATVEVGAVDAGHAIVVRGRTDFALIVTRTDP